jgi:hypothetical protein
MKEFKISHIEIFKNEYIVMSENKEKAINELKNYINYCNNDENNNIKYIETFKTEEYK